MLFCSTQAWTAEKNSPEANTPKFQLPESSAETVETRFNPTQLTLVQDWIRQKVPECPAEASAAAARQFLEELSQRSPEKLDQLPAGAALPAGLESMLLRQVAAKLTGATQTQAREEIARRRIAAVLATGGREPGAALAETAGLLEKIKDASPTQFRRLVEGRMDDDDLQIQLKKASQAGVAKAEAEPARPRELSAADIVAEFSRRNQVGSSVARLQSYAVEGRIKSADGELQDLLLFRMRPDSFRLIVRAGGTTRYILAAHAGHFWQQPPGQAPQPVPVGTLGQRLYLTEFADPLLVDEGYVFERLEDGALDGENFYRIGVRRADGSHYVTRIDPKTYREVGRENDDHSIARYSDFRDVAGVTYAFREEITDQQSRTGVLELIRISANPGLAQDLFEPPARSTPGYYELEGYYRASSGSTALKFK
jgi:hypothetical protein